MIIGLILSLALNLALLGGLFKGIREIGDLLDEEWRSENLINELQSDIARRHLMIEVLEDKLATNTVTHIYRIERQKPERIISDHE